MAAFLILAIYMSIFILSKWNRYIVIERSVLYGGSVSHEQEKDASLEQERKRLL